MKNRIVSFLLATIFSLTPVLCVQAEEVTDLDFNAEKSEEELVISECEELQENEAVFSEQDIIYGRQEVYSIDFNNAVNKSTNASDDNIMSSWLPKGYSRELYIIKGNGTADFLYGAVDVPDDEGNKALKISTPSTLTSDVSNNYLEIDTAGMNPVFPDAESVSTGKNGYVEFSFDFYTDLKSNMRLAVGRYMCADSNESLYEVNKQDLMYLNTDGTLKFFGNTIKTLEVDKIKNSWHNIKIVLRADNKYQVFIDGEAVNELSSVNYGNDRSFRSVRDFRLYNMGVKGVASTKYYDNFKYAVYTDVTDQYELPSISFGDTYAPIINIDEGQSYPIKFVGESVCPKKINIYVDGELKKEYYGSTCEYNYEGTAGKHLVEAELEDEIGNVSERVEITFNVAKKIAIFGEFNNGETSGEYSDSMSRTISFKTTAEKGLDRIEFYVNGEFAATVNEAETEFNFDEFGSGELRIVAVVYDTEGDSKEFEYVANVSMNRLSVLWSEDYEEYTTGTMKISDYVQIAHKNGYSKAMKLGEVSGKDNGTSMALGIEQDLGSDSGEYVNFYNPRGKEHIIFETDFYVSDYPAEDAYIRLAMVQESSVQNSNFMLIGSNINKGQTKLDYDTKTWNHLTIDVDMKNKVYSVLVNNIPFVKDISLASEKSNFESLNYIRFYGPSKDGVPCYIAFDNTKIRAYESYSITSVCSENGSEEISTSDKAIKIFLSENINPDTLDVSKIVIKNDNNALQISELLYDEDKKCITAKLKDVLIGGKKYTIELSDTLETAFGEQLKSSLNSHFTVKSDQRLFVVNTEQSNDVITLNVTASEDIEAYIIAAVWNMEKCKGELITPVSISANGVADVDIKLPFADSKDVVELYVVENLSDFEMLTDDIIKILKQ